MTGCDELRPLLDLAPLGLLEADERVRHDAHLGACGACRAEAEALARHHAADEAAVERELAALQVADLRPEDRPVFEARWKPGPAGPQVDAVRVEAVGRRISLSCSFCHDRVPRDQVAFCASCVAPHHAECFAAHGRCALPGCGELAVVRPRVAARRPRRGELLALVLVAGAGLGAAAWSTSRTGLPGAEALSRALALERDLQAAVRADDRRRADALLLQLDEACEAASRADPLLANRVGVLRAGAERARHTLDVARTSLDVADEELAAVAERLGRQVGRNILVDPDVRERVTLSLRDVRWTEVLRTLAARTRCRIRELAGGVLVLEQPPQVTIQFTDANIRTVLQLLAAYSGKNVVIEPDVKGSVTVDLKEVPWDQALLTLAESNDLVVTLREGGILLVSATRPVDGEPFLLDRAEWSDEPPSLADEGARVDVVAAHTPVPEVCASIARQSGRRIEARGCDERRVSLDVRGVSWRAAVDALAAMARLEVEVHQGGDVVLSPSSSSLLVASDARASTWAQLLATAAEVRLVIPEAASRGVVTTRLPSLEPLQGLEALARQQGWTLRRGDVLELVLPEGWRGEAPPAPAPLTLQATVITPRGAWAIVSDRILARGAGLTGEDGLPIPGSALLEVGDGEATVRLSRDDVRTLRLRPAR